MSRGFFRTISFAIYILCVLTTLIWTKKDKYPYLQESKYVEYYDLLRTENREVLFIDSSEEAKHSSNLLIHKVKAKEKDGLTISTNSDGSFTVNRKNSEDEPTWIILTASDFFLKDGDYCLSDGGISLNNGVYMFLQGVIATGTDEEQRETIVNLSKGDSFFTADQSKYENYLVGIKIPSGTVIDNMIVYPMIRRSTDLDQSYSPCAMIYEPLQGKTGKIALFHLLKKDYNSLGEDDIRIFGNNLKYLYQGEYMWTTLCFEDGTGIQFMDSSPDQGKYGPIDTYGRVLD